MMSEARKYHLNLIVANQFTTQLTDEIRDAVFGNMGTIVSFRVGQNDVEILSRYFQPTFEPEDLLRLPNYNTITRTLIGGVPTQPFTMSTLPAQGNPNSKLADALKQLSAAKYGRPRAVVEKEIFERIATKSEPYQPPSAASPNFRGPEMVGSRPPSYSALGTPPSFSAPGSIPSTTQPSPLPQRPAPKTGSAGFLDDWLNKRTAPTPARAPAFTSAQTASPANPYQAPSTVAQPVAATQPFGYPTSAQYVQNTNSPAPTTAAVNPSANNEIVTPYVHHGTSANGTQQTVDHLAQNLHHPPTQQPTQAAPAPAPSPPEPEPRKTEADVKVHHVATDTEDTIYIDKEGVLHHQ